MTKFFTLTPLALVAALLCGPLAGESAAATFNVSPTQIFLDGKTSSALLTLRNDGDTPLRFQLSVFAWEQSPSGEMVLTPTEDIVFFPALLTLAPREERKVRVGRVVGPAAIERTYRIFVEEMPSLDSVVNGNSVNVLTRMGVPIFVRPDTEASSVAITNVAGGDGVVTFTLANPGTVHIVPDRVVVRGLAGTESVFEGEVQAWYMLAGGTREFSYRLPKDCVFARAVQVEVTYAESTVDQRVDLPAGACIP